MGVGIKNYSQFTILLFCKDNFLKGYSPINKCFFAEKNVLYNVLYNCGIYNVYNCGTSWWLISRKS